MIIPNGAKVKLDPQDDYTHKPEAVSNYNESMYFHAFDANKRVGAWVRIGNRVNEGHAEVTACVYLPDGRVGFMYGRPKIGNNDQMAAGGMAFEVIEPFKKLKISYDAEVILLDHPLDLAEPKTAFKNNPKSPCSIALDITGIAPVHGGELVKLDGSKLDLDAETAVFRGHFEQHIAAQGHIALGGETYTINGFGFRDKSWGPRHWNNFFWYKWVPVTFGPDFGVVLQIMGRPDAPPFINGAVFTGDKLELITSARIETVYDEHFYQTDFTCHFSTAQRDYVMAAKVLSMVPLRHRRILPDGTDSFARITEGFTEYHCDGRVGYGMSEFLDLVVDGKPISLAA